MKNIFLLAPFLLEIAVYSMKITIDPFIVKGPLTKFWKSTGFSPPDFEAAASRKFLLSKDVEINLALISSLPQQGIEFVRIHWLLNLLRINADTSINWDLLDVVIERIVGTDLKPSFELMINPETQKQKEIFQNGDRLFWKRFTSAIAQRYVDIYGRKAVSKWRFETWNEPDLRMYNTLNFGLKEYIEYVNGSIEGIKSVLPDVEIGGPAGLFKDISHHPLCWGFLHYCNETPNKCDLSYISLHKKGNGSSTQILNGTAAFHADLKKRFPSLSILPLVNDESDILSGWWREERWRGDTRYAAAICRTIGLYTTSFNTFSMKSISNDNGFLNIPPQYFNQRTLLTRFIDGDGNAHFVQKPAYAAMGLLALLGEEEVQAKYEPDERFLILSTRMLHRTNNSLLQLNTLIVHSMDKMEINNTENELEIMIFLSNQINACYALYKLENVLPNPRQIWEDFGSPSNPSAVQLATMRKFQEPHNVASGCTAENPFKIMYKIVQPSISFLRICYIGVGKPGKVRKLKAYYVSTHELLLTWKESKKHTSCIKTYVVEYCNDLTVKNCFHRLNEDVLMFNYFFVGPPSKKSEKVSGYYRVAGIDFWERKGHYSNILHFII